MMPVNTWGRPQLKKHDQQRIAKKADAATILETIKQEQTTTWISPDGETHRQIDYIVINHKYRNTVTKAWTIPGWRANPMRQRQHSVICMTIALELLQKYYTPI